MRRRRRRRILSAHQSPQTRDYSPHLSPEHLVSCLSLSLTKSAARSDFRSKSRTYSSNKNLPLSQGHSIQNIPTLESNRSKNGSKDIKHFSELNRSFHFALVYGESTLAVVSWISASPRSLNVERRRSRARGSLFQGGCE